MVTEAQKVKLIKAAREVADKAYAPYSRFRVGAALLCDDGTIFRGVNVENRSFGLTCCAERNALFAAVSAGRRRFTAIAIYSPDNAAPLPPCGACRQVLSEFENPALSVLMSGGGKVTEMTIRELLPLDALHQLKDAGDA